MRIPWAVAFLALPMMAADWDARRRRRRGAAGMRRRSRHWLRARQDRATGAWAAESMNNVYKPESMMAGSMRDAATAFAAIALVE